MWATSFWLGELARGRAHPTGDSLYDREQHRSRAFLYGGHDPGVCCRYLSAWTTGCSAVRSRPWPPPRRRSALANQLAHPPDDRDRARPGCAALLLRRDAGETGSTRGGYRLATEQDLPRGAWPERSSTAGPCGDGRGLAGVTQIHEGVAARRRREHFSDGAAVHARLRRTSSGSSASPSKVSAPPTRRSPPWRERVRVLLSEFHRLRGELLLIRAPSDHGEAEGVFRERSTSRDQGAHRWAVKGGDEPRPALGPRGKRDEARQTLGRGLRSVH